MSTNELTSTLEELKELQLMQEEIAAEIDALRDTIKAEFAARQTDTIIAGCHKATYKPVTSRRLDSKALKAELPELASRFTTASTTMRLTIA